MKLPSIRKSGLWPVLMMTVLFVAVLVRLPAAAPVPDETAQGPLGGRNIYAPHLPWFSFVADSAAALDVGTLKIGTAIYLLNEFSSYPFNLNDPALDPLDPDGRLSPADQDSLTAMDYESTVLELSMDWQALPAWRFSVDWRLHFRYGGFMDSTIEWWHNVLGVSNAGREYYSYNRSYWDIRSSSGASWSGEGTVVESGDLDLGAHWSFWSGEKLSLAAGGAFKIPLGGQSGKDGGFSSGYPDIAAEFLLDWRPWNRWAFYLNAGVIIPLGSEARVMGQFVPAVEFRATRGLSILVQMNIQTAPFSGDVQYTHPTFGDVYMFALPQTDLKIGLKGRSGRLGWQFYIEEDPITWEGPDILVFLGVDWSFQLPGQPKD